MEAVHPSFAVFLLRVIMLLVTVALFFGGIGFGFYWSNRVANGARLDRWNMWPFGLCLMPFILACAVLAQLW